MTTKLIKVNKLVRDNIPEIIEKNGNKVNFFILDEETYKECIKQKIKEESKELFTASTRKEQIEELADLYEIIEAFAKAHNISEKEILEIKKQKKELKGAFNHKKFLTYYEKN